MFVSFVSASLPSTAFAGCVGWPLATLFWDEQAVLSITLTYCAAVAAGVITVLKYVKFQEIVERQVLLWYNFLDRLSAASRTDRTIYDFFDLAYKS